MAEKSSGSLRFPLTTVVGSYPWPAWLGNAPSAADLRDATALVLHTQDLAGIDVVADGELYRMDPGNPDANGMIDYFARRLGGIRTALTRREQEEFAARPGMGYRGRAAGIVDGALSDGTLDLPGDCARARSLTRRPLKFTVTGPHMLAKLLLDRIYEDTHGLALVIARVLAEQIRECDAHVVQIDEANITGHPHEAAWAAEAINIMLDAVRGVGAVHLCFGNYGGQTIQHGAWTALIRYLNRLRADHIVLEMTRRSEAELEALRDVDERLGIGVGVIDIKSNVVETRDEVAARIERAAAALGVERLRCVHPDCGLWMLPRSVADAKLRALVAGRDLFLGQRAQAKEGVSA